MLLFPVRRSEWIKTIDEVLIVAHMSYEVRILQCYPLVNHLIVKGYYFATVARKQAADFLVEPLVGPQKLTVSLCVEDCRLYWINS
jgi:hypothetical protein